MRARFLLGLGQVIAGAEPEPRPARQRAALSLFRLESVSAADNSTIIREARTTPTRNAMNRLCHKVIGLAERRDEQDCRRFHMPRPL